MSEITIHVAEPFRIVKSLQDRYDSEGEAQHLKPVYLMALGMAALKIVELEKMCHSSDAIDLRLDEEIEELMIRQAHDIIAATARPYPWIKNISASALGGFGALVLAAATYAFLKYVDSIGLLSKLW